MVHWIYLLAVTTGTISQRDEVSQSFKVKSGRTSAQIPYGAVRHVDLGKKAITCLRDELCLCFDGRDENVTTYFTKFVSQDGKYCLQTRCPNVENMEYNRSLDLCYRLVETKATWGGANTICDKHGGRLISLNTEEKFRCIKQEFGELPETVWLGAHRSGAQWEWLNGEELLLSNPHWFKHEPNTPAHRHVASGREWHNSFGLDDDSDSKLYKFICEY